MQFLDMKAPYLELKDELDAAYRWPTALKKCSLISN